jgi:hypothetical protein
VDPLDAGDGNMKDELESYFLPQPEDTVVEQIERVRW